MRKALTTVLFAAVSLVAAAQSGTNSPYSQYGLGTLGEQSGGFNRGMNGLGIGFTHGGRALGPCLRICLHDFFARGRFRRGGVRLRIVPGSL